MRPNANSARAAVLALSAIAGAGFLAVPARAAFLNGTTIDSHFDALPGVAGYAGPTSTLAPGTVSPYPGIGSTGIFSVSYTDTQIIILSAGGSTGFASGYTFNGIVFDDIGVIFGTVTIDPVSTLAGFGVGNLAFTANQIQANFDGLQFNSGDQLVLNVGGIADAIPEPASLTLLGAGLVGMALTRRRRPG